MILLKQQSSQVNDSTICLIVDVLLEMYCHIKEKVFPRKTSIAGKNSPFSLSVRSWFRAGVAPISGKQNSL